MRKFISIIVMAAASAVLLTSCEKGVNPDDKIGLAAGFAHCAGLASYWIWGLVITVAICFGLYWYNKAAKQPKPFVYFIAAAIVLTAWFLAPSEVGYNTSVEEASRGVYIR